MSDQHLTSTRRTLLQAASLTAAHLALGMSGAASAAATPPPGKPGEFDFLAGEWRIDHRRLKTAGSNDWEEFTGEATCWTILGGVGSIEELRIPQRNFAGMGLRLLDVEKKLWNDFWVNSKSGVLSPPGLIGGFDNGVGTFTAEEQDGDRTIVSRGVWDRITPASCRWSQAVSSDGGKTWDTNWLMNWKRVPTK